MNKKFLGLLGVAALLATAGMAAAQSPAYRTPYSPETQPAERSLTQQIGEAIFGKNRNPAPPTDPEDPMQSVRPSRSAHRSQPAQSRPEDEDVVMIDGELMQRSAPRPVREMSDGEEAETPHVARAPQGVASPAGEGRSIYMRRSAAVEDEAPMLDGEPQDTRREVVGAWVEEPDQSGANLEEVLYGRRPPSSTAAARPVTTPARPTAQSARVTAPAPGAAVPKETVADNESPEAGFASAESLSDGNPSSTPAPSTASKPQTVNPASRPVHERLRSLQRSAFDPPPASSVAAPAATTTPAKTAVTPAQPAPAVAQTAPAAAQPVPTVAQPVPAVTEPISAAAPPPVAVDPMPSVAETPAAAPASEPAAQPTPVSEPAVVSPAPQSAAASPAQPVAPANEPAPLASPAPAVAKPAARATARGDQGVLFTRQSPILGVETLGPRQIVVGKESTYQFKLGNTGEVGATDVVVYVELPPWAEVAGAAATAGETESQAGEAQSQTVAWKVGRLDARSQERLELRIIPRESKPFDLAVRWDFQPMASQASIEVQEAKLALQLDGPREVLFGHGEVYKLKLSNTGNGAAENVVLTLLPLGTGQNAPVTHDLGTLAAGSDRTIEIELTARQAGDLRIKVSAQSDGSAYAELNETVFVRRAELQVAVDGPKFQYVSTVANFRVEVANVGSAPAEKVTMTARLPAGARYISGIEGARFDAEKSELRWPADNLDAGARRTYDMRCTFTAAGNGRMEIVSAGADGVSASAEAITRVEAMADLSLEVADPSGPVLVGEEAAYELRVHNRGTKSAQGIEVVVYFSHGIEPTRVEGGAHKIGSGQVVFSPVSTLDAGQTLTLKVNARAESAGNHIFRAEVYCRPLGARLVSEETTHFYSADPVTTAPPAAPPMRETPAAPPYTSPRTATRDLSAGPYSVGPGPVVPPATLPGPMPEILGDPAPASQP